MPSLDALRDEVVQFGARLYARGFVTASDGNISVRRGEDTLLITPSGSCLGELTPDALLVVDPEGTVREGAGRPTSELPMHLAVYETRPDVAAVIHAHPLTAVACAAAGVPIDDPVIPEVVVMLGAIPTADYATPSGPESAAAVRTWIDRHDALLLDRHGSVTVGTTLTEAFRKLEKVEYAAQVVFLARQLGTLRTLTPEQIAKLEDVAIKLGLRGGPR